MFNLQSTDCRLKNKPPTGRGPRPPPSSRTSGSSCYRPPCTPPGPPSEKSGSRFSSSGWRAAPGWTRLRTKHPRCSPSWHWSRSTSCLPAGCSSPPGPCSVIFAHKKPSRLRGKPACVASSQKERRGMQGGLGMRRRPVARCSPESPRPGSPMPCLNPAAAGLWDLWDRLCCPQRRKCSRHWRCRWERGNAPPARPDSASWWRHRWRWRRPRLDSTWSPARGTALALERGWELSGFHERTHCVLLHKRAEEGNQLQN